MTGDRMMFWIGPGADDRALWRTLVEAGRGQISHPAITEELALHDGEDEDMPQLGDATRAMVVRDNRLVGATARRRLRAAMGPGGFVVQIVREPITALSRELRRQQAMGLVRRWTSPGNATSTELHVTSRMAAERVLPRLAYERRGRAFTPSRGRRLVIDREELTDPKMQRLRAPIDALLAHMDTRVAWEGIGRPRDTDDTEILLMLARGPIDVEGARVPVELLPTADLVHRHDRTVLARVPSIAPRVAFPMEDAPLSLVVETARLVRLPRGLRHALTETGVVQHVLEEDLLPRWIERADQVHRELAKEPPVSPGVAMKVRRALRHELDEIFSLRPTLRGRWGLLVEQAIAP